MENPLNNNEEHSETPSAPALPEDPSPRQDWRRYRVLIICGLILVFIGYIFAAREYAGVEQATAPGKIVAKTLEMEHEKDSGILKLRVGSDRAPASSLPAAGPESAGPAPAEPPAPATPPLTVRKEEPGPAANPALPSPPASPAGEPAVERPVIPTPPPPPPAAEKMAAKPAPVKGEAFTNALIKIMDDQVNGSLIGWRPNSILFGKLGLTDDVNNLQLGVLEVTRRTVVVLNENMSRFALTEAQNPYLNNAMNFFMVSPEKYWFPSASGKYKEAMAYLEHYIDDLKHNRSRFYTRVDNLIALMNHFRDVLGSAFHNLIKDTEADGSKVSWFVCDDYFYFAQGVAMGMAQILEGVKEDFADQLAKKNSSKLVDDAIHALHEASHLNPWIITNASKDGILANHRANMGTYIGEAEHIISTLINVLATN